MNKKSPYRANGKEFSLISEAKAEARRALIGQPEDYSILVYEWIATTTKELAPGYWEPIAQAVYDKYHKIVCR